jgi:putative ABC transport system substrate-binding protein
MPYGASLSTLFERAADYVDRVLLGASPADLPVEQPVRLHLVVNVHTARQLRLELPPALLVRADEVLGVPLPPSGQRRRGDNVLAP